MQDQLFTQEEREALEDRANRVLMHQEIRNGKPVLVDYYRHGPLKGQEIVIPDYVRNQRSNKLPRRNRTPGLFGQVLMAVVMLVAGLLVYLSIIGL